MIYRNGTKAALAAGYSAKCAHSTASALLKDPEIKAQLELRMRLASQHADLTAERTLEELRRLAFADLRGVFDMDGGLLNPSEWSDATASAVAGLEVVKGNVVSGDRQSDYIHKVKLWDKTRALEMLAKYFKLLTDVIRIESDDVLIEKLRQGRQRAAASKRVGAGER